MREPGASTIEARSERGGLMAEGSGSNVTRRAFLAGLALLGQCGATAAYDQWTYTVTGRVSTSGLGLTLPHEHVLVDFVGAGKAGRDRYDAEDVFRRVLPHLEAFKAAGGRALAECTPAFLGRDPQLLVRLSKASGVALLTNTGYYGAAQDKYVPAHAFDEPAEKLATRWTAEFEGGIEGSGIRPGFIKIGVDSGALSAIDRTLARAAAICHRDTGLVICCHSGNGEAAFDALDTLKAEGVSPDAFVWVHAQNEKDPAVHLKAARAGAWVSLDGFRSASLDTYVRAVGAVIDGGRIDRLLVSQDAGWYRVGEPAGGQFTPYTGLLEELLPALRKSGVTEDQVRTLVVANPANAFGVRRRLLAAR
jgi:phosphotriesterase-related protein